MFSKKISRAYKGLFASLMLLATVPLLADLVVSINQTNPFPPSAICGDGGVPAQVGGTVTYAITVTNNGPTAIDSFVFDDALTSAINTAGICLVSISTCGAACEDFVITPRQNGFHVNFGGKLAVNQSFTFTATFRICTGLNDSNQDLLTNTAIATGFDCEGVFVSSGFITATTCVQGCALAVTVTPAILTNVCETGSVTLTANATGSCENPSCLTYTWFAPSNPTPVQTGTCNQLIVSADALPFCPTTAIYTVVVTDNLTQCTVTATSAPLCAVPCADLEIKKIGRTSCDQVIYTVSVTNNSGTTSSGVTVTDCLPSCLTILEINPLGGTFWSNTVNNNCLSAVLVDVNGAPVNLLPGETVSFEIVTEVTGCCGKTICNTATVQGSVFDPIQSNNSSTVKIHRKH